MNCFSSCNTWTITAPVRLALVAGLIRESRLMPLSSDRKLLSVRVSSVMDCDGGWTRLLSGSGSTAVFSAGMNDGDSFGILPGLPELTTWLLYKRPTWRNCESCLEQNWVLNYPQRNYNHEKKTKKHVFRSFWKVFLKAWRYISLRNIWMNI